MLTPLYSCFLMLVLLTVGQQCLNLRIEQKTRQTADWVTHSLLVEKEAERLLNAAIDEERATLEDYTQEHSAFSDSFNHLYNLVKDNHTQLKQLEQIKYLHNGWQSELDRMKLFNANRSALVLAQAQNDECRLTRRQQDTDIQRSSTSQSCLDEALAEQTAFDYLRTQIQSLLEREEILLGERKHRLEQLYRINTAMNILSTVAILLGVGWNIRLLHSKVHVPLHKLTEVGKLWQAGQMEVQLDYSSPDEIGQLAGILDAMADQAYQRQQHIEVCNQNLKNLISGLSHDLRTPLLATRTTLDSMLKGAFGMVDNTWREVFQEYRQANEDLLKLVEALLDVSRYEANNTTHLSYEPLNWERIFVKAIAQIEASSKRQLILSYNISQLVPIVYGDELEIRRVVQNLLDNAVRVSELNKEIFLEVALLGVDRVKVSVSDRGPGIPPQEKERLFHRFTQGQGRRGTAGLGLYLCRQIIEFHRGTIGAESTFGEGSTFWFTLPVSTDKAKFRHELEMEEK
ncbi:MAG: ATP-binding protein [Rhizonema sp. NSF051]|nr:ATP-binding protein [Rhizonema sp. NSF051]